MSRLLRRAQRIALTCALGASLVVAAVAAVDSVSSSQLAFGTIVTVNGSGFGTRPSAYLRNTATNRRTRASVARAPAATDAAFRFTAPRAVAGSYELGVVPKGVRTPFLVDGFTVEKPQLGALSPTRGAPRSEVTISGTFLGTRKGTVRLGAKRKARVVSWTGTQIRFVVPRLAVGAVDVTVLNTAGASAPLVGAFTVTAPGTSDDRMTFTAGTLAGDIHDGVIDSVSVEDQDLGATHRVVVRGLHATASPETSTAVLLDGFVVEGSTFPQTLSGNVISISLTKSAGAAPTEDYAGTGTADALDPSHDIQVRIDSFDGTTATGAFSGTMKRSTVGSLGATLFIEGTFRATSP